MLCILRGTEGTCLARLLPQSVEFGQLKNCGGRDSNQPQQQCKQKIALTQLDEISLDVSQRKHRRDRDRPVR